MLGWKLSEAEKSRKGLIITSLQVDSRKMYFVNVHLYHDADNVVAMSKSPSEYAEKRTRGLVEVFQILLTRGGASVNDGIFVFGDLNTRLDGHRFIQNSNSESERVKVKAKCLKMPEELWGRFSTPGAWPALRELDREGQMMMDSVAEVCKVQLCELPREFGPTYSLSNEEGMEDCGTYKEERLPAWCDRVFANAAAMTSVADFQYWVCPLHVLDHRGVYLIFTMLE
jgi:inositol-1,4,5-trisphosphate 5-phosphatase